MLLLTTMMSVACWTRELELEPPVEPSMDIEDDEAQLPDDEAQHSHRDGGVARRLAIHKLGSPGAVSRSRFYDRIRIYKDFHLHFKITPTGTVSGWSNILHITDTETNSGWGARIPGVWFHSNSNRLHVCIACDGNSNFCVNPSTELPVNEETYVYVISFMGQFIVGIENTALGIYESVTAKCDVPYEPSWGMTQSSTHSGSTMSSTPPTASLYTSGPWHTAAKATLKDVQYEGHNGGESHGMEKGMLVTDQLETVREYTLKFTLYPFRVQPHYTNILHITESGTHGYGPPIPSVGYNANSSSLLVCTYCKGKTSQRACVLTPELPLMSRSHVKVEISPGSGTNSPHWFTVSVDNADVEITAVSTNCYDPYIPTKGMLYQSAPWYHSADGYLLDVEYTATASGRRLEESDVVLEERRLEEPQVVGEPTRTQEEFPGLRRLTERLSPADGAGDLSGAENGGGL